MAKKKVKPPNPEGRPSEYDPAYCADLIHHMSEGYSFEAFAGKLLKSKQTLYNWMEKHPEFMDAKKIGDMACLYKWETFNLEGVFSTDGVHANTGIIAFNMKNRFGWRDKHEVVAEVTTNDQSKQVKELYEQLKAVRELK